jgi:hypothetical protein
MRQDDEFEMLVNVMKAQTFIRNAEGWAKGGWTEHAGLTNARLEDAKALLQAIVDDCSEENQRLASGMVNG